MTPAILAGRLTELFGNPAALQLAAAAARSFARDDAAERLSALVLAAALAPQIAERAA